jgi:hypothetical protein
MVLQVDIHQRLKCECSSECQVSFYLYYADGENLSRIRNGYYPLDVVDKLEKSTMTKVEDWMNKKIAAGKNNNCTLENAAVRREWSVSLPYYTSGTC